MHSPRRFSKAYQLLNERDKLKHEEDSEPLWRKTLLLSPPRSHADDPEYVLASLVDAVGAREAQEESQRTQQQHGVGGILTREEKRQPAKRADSRASAVNPYDDSSSAASSGAAEQQRPKSSPRTEQERRINNVAKQRNNYNSGNKSKAAARVPFKTKPSEMLRVIREKDEAQQRKMARLTAEGRRLERELGWDTTPGATTAPLGDDAWQETVKREQRVAAKKDTARSSRQKQPQPVTEATTTRTATPNQKNGLSAAAAAGTDTGSVPAAQHMALRRELDAARRQQAVASAELARRREIDQHQQSQNQSQQQHQANSSYSGNGGGGDVAAAQEIERHKQGIARKQHDTLQRQRVSQKASQRAARDAWSTVGKTTPTPLQSTSKKKSKKATHLSTSARVLIDELMSTAARDPSPRHGHPDPAPHDAAQSAAPQQGRQPQQQRYAVTDYNYSRQMLQQHASKCRHHREEMASRGSSTIGGHNDHTTNNNSTTVMSARSGGRKHRKSSMFEEYYSSPEYAQKQQSRIKKERNGSVPRVGDGGAFGSVSPLSDDAQERQRATSASPQRQRLQQQRQQSPSAITRKSNASPPAASSSSPLRQERLTQEQKRALSHLGSLPAPQYLAELGVATPQLLALELRSWERRHRDNLYHTGGPREWLALTSLVNHPTVLTHAIAPFILAELQATAAAGTRDIGPENETRRNQLLCVICGLGSVARCCLDMLVALMTNGIGDRKLVALAIRCVGGREGMEAALKALQSSDDAKVRATAAYAVGLMPNAVRGRSTLLVFDGPRLENRMSFFQPEARRRNAVAASQPGNDQDDFVATSHQMAAAAAAAATGTTASSGLIAPKPPNYRATHMLLDANTIQRLLLEFVHSEYYASSLPYPRHATVVADFFTSIAFVRPKIGLESSVDAVVQTLYDEATSIVNAGATADAFLAHSLQELLLLSQGSSSSAAQQQSSSSRGDVKLQSMVTTSLMRHLSFEAEKDDVVQEQVIFTLTCLPDAVTAPLLPVVLATARKMATALLAQTHQQQHQQKEKITAVVLVSQRVVSAAILGTAQLLRSARLSAQGGSSGSSSSVASDVVEWLTGLLFCEVWKVRHLACLALGMVGRVAAPAVPALIECMESAKLSVCSTVTTLCSIGASGVAYVANLLASGDSAGDRSNMDLRVETARGIAQAQINPRLVGENSGKLMEALASACAAAINNEAHQPLCEELVVECLSTLGALITPVSRMLQRQREASAGGQQHDPTPVQNLLLPLLLDPTVSRTLQLAMARTMGEHGGPAAELALIRLMLEDDAQSVRSACAAALRFQGASPARALFLALNDSQDCVRAMALESLAAIGSGAVVAALGQGPAEHRTQILRACTEFMHMHPSNNSSVVREVYEFLVGSDE